ncbi:hypothetical protein WA026_014719 [Henosepilachna vigintioctopunctata]|uniref:tRNA-splicing endonuclease subunit Sen15 domain-containing protein n=1 Tax=Henosepilachna vigintioctopunctata TaxID=420089 RepID=A0AAW1VGZ1_9CUCU
MSYIVPVEFNLNFLFDILSTNIFFILMDDQFIADILSQGCPTKREAAMVKQIYLELCEVKRYWDVEYFFHDGHKTTYLKAKIKKCDKPSLFIPKHVSDKNSFIEMMKLLELNNEGEFSGIYLAFINPDSTCVYYQISEGLVKPKEITSKHLTRNKQETLDFNLRKHRNLLQQSALYGIPITLPEQTMDKETASTSSCKNENIKE